MFDPSSDPLTLKSLYDGFRNPETIRQLAQQIKEAAAQLTEPLYIMEVCGGHTHTIMKFGLPQLLPRNIQFIHGPGCPVCIMPKERIDHAAALAQQPNVILVTLGDMIRVPGSKGNLAQVRAQGADIRAIYDPLDCLQIAQDNPDKQVVFFAIGFETSTPMTAALVLQTQALGLTNLSFHINHVLVPPAVDAVMQGEETKVNAFIAPSHVSVIQGAKIYRPILERYQLPMVVAGFEPVDVLEAILWLTQQTVSNSPALAIQYSRAVSEQGNLHAQKLVEQCFEVRDVFRWRGLGPIANSALQLKAEFAAFDAETLFAEILPQTPIDDHKACICGSILRGVAKPTDCKVFGRGCTPQTPLGSCMVSSEGACHAYLKYGARFNKQQGI